MISDYLINMACPTCGLSLMQSPRVAVTRIVFCTECRSGGHYSDVVDDGKPLIPDFITLNELDAMLSAIGHESS